MTKGNLKEMSGEFLRAATFEGYGCTLYLGIGIPIPVLNPGLARKTGVSDREIVTNIVDYGIASEPRPVVKRVTYAELKSGRVELKGRKVKTSSISSLYMARKVALTLKNWIETGRFLLSEPVERLSLDASFKPMKIKTPSRAHSQRSAAFNFPSSSYVGVDGEKCINCGACISLCKPGVFYFDVEGRLKVDADRCIRCNLCKDVCPVGAIYIREV